ncbi:hydroxyacid dehydrogenase [Pollutimonas bauzanensis]|uniref:D-3-phosphoglycerate dehydrogenase n=1 Tax=Pollutimonas bauzanensis TaxID=658167 RepID=A0A1M5QQW9_9BURK|nr:hydroxyacid dehydrogenase [Pollutimonas bauzanensis]SHH16514.1 D-3-phosphoglycerate dehydrogenase [Pollutimonas bauzanensis]
MKNTPKKVVRFNFWSDASFEDILGASPQASLEVLDVRGDEERNWAHLAQADIYHISSAKDEVPPAWLVTPQLIQRCPALVCVSTAGAGYDTVDVQACTQAGILVVNQAGGNANSVAEHAIGLMLAVARRIVESDHRLRTETGFSREDLMGHELNGKVLGLVGLGHTGTRTARLGAAFGMRVLAYDPYLDENAIAARGAQAATLEQLLEASDIVSLHCPRTRETSGMLGAQAFAKMKRRALFISTARGGIHDEAALHGALASGHLGGAGLDVWQVEPPRADHPLLSLRNVVSTYHTAGVTHECRRNVATMAAEQILQVCRGETPARMVNSEVLPDFLARLRAAADFFE